MCVCNNVRVWLGPADDETTPHNDGAARPALSVSLLYGASGIRSQQVLPGWSGDDDDG